MSVVAVSATLPSPLLLEEVMGMLLILLLLLEVVIVLLLRVDVLVDAIESLTNVTFDFDGIEQRLL